MKSQNAFTLIELLTVVAIVAILAALILPTLSIAKGKAKSIQCASVMRQWSIAAISYVGDNDDAMPYFSDDSQTRLSGGPNVMWNELIGKYLGLSASDDRAFSGPGLNDGWFVHHVQRCPSGRPEKPPFNKLPDPFWPIHHNAYVGVVLGYLSAFALEPRQDKKLISLFQSITGEPVKIDRVRKVSEAMLYLDAVFAEVKSPANPNLGFNRDADDDGVVDTNRKYFELGLLAYNGARPKIHRGGCNVALLDGHVEWVNSRELWKTDRQREVTHRFWYLD